MEAARIREEARVFLLYGAAHALLIGSIVAGSVAVLWLVVRAGQNYRISTNRLYASRHRRARLLISAPSFVLAAALLLGAAGWLIGQTRVSTTTVGALADEGRTSNQAGLRTEAEVYQTTVTTTVYYRLPGKTAPVAVREALGWVHKSLAKTPEAAADAKKLKQILKTDLAVLCRRQRCC